MSYHELAPMRMLDSLTQWENRRLEPDDPEEIKFDECACCGEPIYVGDEYYESEDGEFKFHVDCIRLKIAED